MRQAPLGHSCFFSHYWGVISAQPGPFLPHIIMLEGQEEPGSGQSGLMPWDRVWDHMVSWSRLQVLTSAGLGASPAAGKHWFSSGWITAGLSATSISVQQGLVCEAQRGGQEVAGPEESILDGQFGCQQRPKTFSDFKGR